MKIALVSRYFNRRQGIPHDVVELAVRFADTHEVHVFSQTCEDVDDSRIIFHKVPAVMPRSFRNELFFFIIAGIMLGKHRFDVINFHDPCMIKDGVFTSHAFPRAGMKIMREINARADTGIPASFYKPFELFYPVSDYNMKPGRAGRVIAVSGMIKENIISLLGRDTDRIDVVPNGIDTQKFNPESRSMYRTGTRNTFGFSGKDFVILFAGYYHLRKGLQFLVRALGLIDDSSIKILVVGNDDSARDYILSLADRHHAAGRILFAGDRIDIQKYFAAGDALVLPTLYEPFGNVVLEAMGCGVPVAVSRMAGVSDLIRDNENGLLIDDPADPEEIARKIMYLYQDPDRTKRIGELGAETAQNHSWDIIAGKTMAVFNTYLEEKKRKTR